MTDKTDLGRFINRGETLIPDKGPAITIDDLWRSVSNGKVDKNGFICAIRTWAGLLEEDLSYGSENPSHERDLLNDLAGSAKSTLRALLAVEADDGSNVRLSLAAQYSPSRSGRIWSPPSRVKDGERRSRPLSGAKSEIPRDSTDSVKYLWNMRQYLEWLINDATNAAKQADSMVQGGGSISKRHSSAIKQTAWVDLAVIWQWAHGEPFGEAFQTFAVEALSRLFLKDDIDANSGRLCKAAIKKVRDPECSTWLSYLP